MALVDFPFKPGLYSDTTDRGIGKLSQWKNGDRVRFYRGFPETIGGWTQAGAPALTGTPRAAADWQTLRLEDLIAVGTNSRLYILDGIALHDIVPIRATATLTDPFDTVSASSTVTVTDSAHGAVAGDYVSFSGATAVGGLTIDGAYDVLAVTDVDHYTIDAGTPASSTATGGGTVSVEYGINTGLVDSAVLTGYGVGPYGLDAYGTPRTPGFVKPAQLWSLDNWGEDLIACYRDGDIYVWQSSMGPLVHATLIANAPTDNKFIFVSQEDRHLIALGADGDPMLIRWCTQEDYDDWTPTVTNTAGDKRLDQGNQLMCAVKLRGEHLLFTDAAVYSMQFVGPPDTYGFRPMGSNYGFLGPNAVREFEGKAFWMGARGFYYYDGAVHDLECPVLDHVFGDINLVERFKIHTAFNYRFSEIWWFYASEASVEIDRYVAFNPVENVWTFGTLDRTVMIADSDVLVTPYGFSPDGVFYYHENGTDADGAPLNPFLETGDMEISIQNDQAGNLLAHVSKYIPDFERLAGEVQFTVTGRKYPQDSEAQASGPHTVDNTTKFVNPRMRCRQVYMRWESINLGDTWRMGIVRMDLIPHGGR